MEMILFYITKSKELIISFLICMFLIAIGFYGIMRKFNQNNKLKVILYGLFLHMTNLDLIKLSIIMVKNFLLIYAIIIKDKINIYISFIMIAILAILYVIFYYRRLIHETICTIIECAGIYFIYWANEYITKVDEFNIVLLMYWFSIVALISFVAYLFFKELDIISNARADKINQNGVLKNE